MTKYCQEHLDLELDDYLMDLLSDLATSVENIGISNLDSTDYSTSSITSITNNSSDNMMKQNYSRNISKLRTVNENILPSTDWTNISWNSMLLELTKPGMIQNSNNNNYNNNNHNNNNCNNKEMFMELPLPESMSHRNSTSSTESSIILSNLSISNDSRDSGESNGDGDNSIQAKKRRMNKQTSRSSSTSSSGSSSNNSNNTTTMTIRNRKNHRKAVNVTAMEIPNILFSAVNEGNIMKILQLSKKHIHPQCLVDLTSPCTRMTKIGSDFVPKFYEALINTHPDGIVSVRQINGWEEDGMYKVKCHLRFRGTRLHEKYIFDFFGLVKGRKLSLFFDVTKMSQDELSYYKQLEEEMAATGKKPIVFIKVELVLAIDQSTNRIKEYVAKSRLSSFRLIDVQA